MNNHDLLGVSPNADAGEIKRAFREAAKELHPDHSDSPEAAEAFARIKEAHDALLKQAETPRESSTVQSATARAAASTAAAAFTKTDDGVDDEATKIVQELDEAVRQSQKNASFFGRKKESEEVKKHRKKIKTNERRLRGLY
jgi:DnaJ-class molecular chaperone